MKRVERPSAKPSPHWVYKSPRRRHSSSMPRPVRDLNRLFRQHRRHVYRRAMNLMGNASDAEDVVQDVFIKAMRGPELHGREMVAWLYRVTTNRCLDILRGRKRRKALMDEVVRPATADRVESNSDESLTLRWLLSNADPRQAQIAVYIYVDDLPAQRAAELMGVSRRTAFNLLGRFRTWAKNQTELLEASS